ncbi:hypothetical protein [Hydrogenophilus thiooxidans]|uniref:hypothetical protein n=1 Tax=Hydrogenophilus thiooxidans TaxID=2820326 RepID=UPI001C237E6D|nr:hypothetical protein [Hydrogenophilus thiooxidans]
MCRNTALLFSLTLALANGSSHATTLYRCLGANGTETWQERPCPHGQAVTVAPQPFIDRSAPPPSARETPSVPAQSRQKRADAPPLDPATRVRLQEIEHEIAQLLAEQRALKAQLEADLAALRIAPLPDDPRSKKAAHQARETQIRERERRYRAEVRVLETRIKGLQSEAKALRAQR